MDFSEARERIMEQHRQHKADWAKYIAEEAKRNACYECEEKGETLLLARNIIEEIGYIQRSSNDHSTLYECRCCHGMGYGPSHNPGCRMQDVLEKIKEILGDNIQ